MSNKPFKFVIGDIANGIETSKETIEKQNYLEALEDMIESTNVYCRAADKRAEQHVTLLRQISRSLQDNTMSVYSVFVTFNCEDIPSYSLGTFFSQESANRFAAYVRKHKEDIGALLGIDTPVTGGIKEVFVLRENVYETQEQFLKDHRENNLK